MDERAAAQAFEDRITALPIVQRPGDVYRGDLDASIQIAGELRALASEWGDQTSPALQREVALLADRAGVIDVDTATTNRFERRPFLRFGIALTAAATLVIAIVPGAREGAARQLYRVLDAFVVGPNTQVVRPDSGTREETAATLQQFERQLGSGRAWHFSTGFGDGVGGAVPAGASPALQRVDRLDVLRSLTSMPILQPGAVHRGTIPTFNHAMLAPDGALFLFFGAGRSEILLEQFNVGSGRSVVHSRVVCCWDELGKPRQYSPPLQTEELFLDGRVVVWDPDNTGLMPDSSALRWERDGISYSLMGRALTRDEAVQLFLSLQTASGQH